jgi:hypothetical protein
MVLKKRIEKLQVTLWVRARQISAQINESLILPEDTNEYSRLKALEAQLDTVRKRLAKVEYIAQARLDKKQMLKKMFIETPNAITNNSIAVTAP